MVTVMSRLKHDSLLASVPWTARAHTPAALRYTFRSLSSIIQAAWQLLVLSSTFLFSFFAQNTLRPRPRPAQPVASPASGPGCSLDPERGLAAQHPLQHVGAAAPGRLDQIWQPHLMLAITSDTAPSTISSILV
jgi:hypothetical protein